jgi:RimJ/RimL family protein N-acetyltransferase
LEQNIPPINSYSIRRFLPEDLELYKAIRLESLQLEAAMFSSNYAREASFTDQQWLDRINGHNSDCFGLFYGDQLIGVTAIVTDWNDPTLALMTQSYIRQEHRGKGLSRLLYESRLAWVAERPQIMRLRIGHRESNHISKAANQHHGFKYVMREPCDWPDGCREDILYYELVLK